MSDIEAIRAHLRAGKIIPYLGPGVWALSPEPLPAPASALSLVDKLTERASVPFKIRKNLTAAAQYIENFKHRKTLVAQMNAAFAPKVAPNLLHEWLAAANLPLVVDAWYIPAMREALKAQPSWGEVQGVSRAEHYGEWVRYYASTGERVTALEAALWQTLLYCPLGSSAPAQNYIVSDSDFVEVLTEIDIQTPIPEAVQSRRADRNFLFLGCRFTNQLERIFARQIMKRSSARHWAVIQGELSKNEKRFLDELGIVRLDLPLAEALAFLER